MYGAFRLRPLISLMPVDTILILGGDGLLMGSRKEGRMYPLPLESFPHCIRFCQQVVKPLTKTFGKGQTMKIIFTAGTIEKTTVEFIRGWFWGKIRIRADGKEVYVNSIANLATHFSLKLTRCYDFSVGVKEVKKIQIKTTRPLLLAGLRPQKYEVFCDGQLIATQEGY